MTALFAALFAFALQEEKVLPKIAEIESIAGTVELVDAKKNSRAVTKFGRRLKNSDVRDEDTVKTSAGSQAVIVFPDRSRYTMKEKSEVQILQKSLAKPTPEGNTIGRRLRLLVGVLTSEVMPNTEVRTDFETPAGAVAVRGTRLRLAYDPEKRSLDTSVDNGRLWFINAEYSTLLNLPSGSAVTFTLGSLEIRVTGGEGVEGSIGDRWLRLGAGDEVALQMRGAAIQCEIRAGVVELRNSATGNFEGRRENFEAARTDDAAKESAVFDPNAPSVGQEAPAGGVEEPLISDASAGTSTTSSDPLTGTTQLVATSPTQTSTTSTGTGLSSPVVIDDFNRPAGTVIGNGWTEEQVPGPTDWQISPPTGAYVVIPGSGNSIASLAMNYGFVPAPWKFEASFSDSVPTAGPVNPFLEVNSPAPNPFTGCHVKYVAFPTGTLMLGDSTGGVLASLGNIGSEPSPILTLSASGSTLCGSAQGMNIMGGTQTVCASSFT